MEVEDMKDKMFLQWLHDRFVKVHKTNFDVDYMRRLRAIISATPDDKDTRYNITTPSVEKRKGFELTTTFPIGEHCVSMMNFKDEIIIATTHNVYVLNDGKLELLEVES